MKIGVLIILIVLFGCGKVKNKHTSIEFINSGGEQDSIFNQLVALTWNTIKDTTLNDSLAFLILPVQASCPGCRIKTIDSIVKNRDRLKEHHYIIVSANGGRKKINGFFYEQGEELPVIENKFFLDTLNLSYHLNLCEEKPTIYYTYNKKAYKKVAAIPATVRQDLQEFFSGNRNNTN
jgi:hypothetical protein